jgi:hypothetical protein
MFAVNEFLRAFGCAPALYWLAASGTLALLLAIALGPWIRTDAHRSVRASAAVFLIALLLAMIAWRWPAMLHFKAVNPDEPQWLAAALTMLARGTFWWPDLSTSGPLVAAPLTAPAWLGLPVDYVTGRAVALLLEWAQVGLVYLTLRHLHGDRAARLLVLPLACLMVCLFFWDFVPYCSELAPLFFTALAIWLGVTAFSKEGRVISRPRLAASGLALGVLPFSKFQVLPIGAALGVTFVLWAVCQPGTDARTKSRDLFCLLAGTAFAFASLLFTLRLTGLGADFYQSYVVHNLDYAQARALPWSESAYVLKHLSAVSWGFSTFHGGLLLLILCGLRGAKRSAWRPLLLGWLLVLAAYVAVLTPGRLYPHYLLFLTLPLALVAGLQFGWLLENSRHAGRWTFVFVGLGVVPQVIERAWDRPELMRLIRPVAPWSNVTGFINRVKRPGDSLAVWGWRPDLYVDTQLPQATREGHTFVQLTEGPMREYYRQRFLADLRGNHPAFFVDSVGPDDFAYHDNTRDGHETFPALAELVRREYVPMNQTGSIRVFVRRDLTR